MKKFLLIFLLALLFLDSTHSQVVLNEFMSSNNASPGTFEPDLSNSIQDEIIPDPFTCAVFPVPFTSSVTLQCISKNRSEIHIVMSDVHGRIVKRISNKMLDMGPNLMEIRTDDLDAGVYLISVRSPHGKYSRKVICVN